MVDWLSSPRRRRRLAWTAGFVLAVAAAVPLAVKYSNTGERLPSAPLETGAVTTVAAPERLRVTPAVRRQVGETVQNFVRTAVIRKNLDAAWQLASPLMRSGLTRAEWRRGDIPVQPYPARAFKSADWQLRYVSERTLGIDVLVQPKHGSGAPVAVYAAELTAPGESRPRRFLVDSWVPQATLGAASPPPAKQERGGKTETVAESPYSKGRLGAEWLLVPAAIGLLLVGALVALAVRGVLRRRRAERAWREHSRR